MAKKPKPAIEIASDIGWLAAQLHAHGDAEAEKAMLVLWGVNPLAFAWLSLRLDAVLKQRYEQARSVDAVARTASSEAEPSTRAENKKAG